MSLRNRVETWVLLISPLVLLSFAIEAALLHRSRQNGRRDLRGYERADTAASLAMGVGNVVISFAVHGRMLSLYSWLYDHRLLDIGNGLAVWAALFVLEDFTSYWWHRASHEVRCLWAAHENHHSSERFNLSTALRASWTTPFTIPLFYWWLPLAGFHPQLLFAQVAASQAYQFWIHTEVIGPLGPLERVLITPSHHRVHHAANAPYLDRNYGGVLIIWDRLFGTFAEQSTPLQYGLTTNIDTYNPVRIAIHEWAAIYRDMLQPAPLCVRLARVFGAPGRVPPGVAAP